ncbi:uncharacterized protein LOC115350322 isoform X1 [Aquila chrysaetos chrysaetos]|uniref:uncharacterized protein LOC115350322 isoform X1 n=1 Tax=Aquila chrysaetos chrysaetos TaxID=223781 RepID=UPI001176634B|nr:uncharacterized protein LOC115350322 isoform X1 [Aquila chrysaetos chrysaetos]
MLWETKGNRRNTFCLHTHMFIIPNFHFSERVWAGSCSHHKRGIFLPDFAALQAKRGGTRTSAGAAARALPAAASGHRGAEEEMPGGEPGAAPLSLIAAERARERKLPQTRQQNAGLRRLRARRLRADIISLGAEIADPREKEKIGFARKRFPDAAHEQPPPKAAAVNTLEVQQAIGFKGQEEIPPRLPAAWQLSADLRSKKSIGMLGWWN